jgi:hypothetical protein
MKKKQIYKTTFILINLFFLILNGIYSQSAAKIENIKFDAEGSKLVITYDIMKSKEGETFEIWVKIKTAKGKEIIPNTIYGDVKKGVAGGPNKRVVWDVEADNVDLSEEFSVEVYGRSDSKSPSSVGEPLKEKQAKARGEGIGTGKALLLSAVLPGLGNRAVKGGGAQWLIGVAGYGCVIGSIALNRSAYNAYEDYKLADNSADRDDYFSKAENNDKVSKILIGGAAAIWIADLVWTGLQAGKARKGSKSPVSINYYYDPYLNKPMFGLGYRF